MKISLFILSLIIFVVSVCAANDLGERKPLPLSLRSYGETHDGCRRFLRLNPQYSTIAFKGEGDDFVCLTREEHVFKFEVNNSG